MAPRLTLLALLALALAGCRGPAVSTPQDPAVCAASHLPPGWGRPSGAELLAACPHVVPACAPPTLPVPRSGVPGWGR